MCGGKQVFRAFPIFEAEELYTTCLQCQLKYSKPVIIRLLIEKMAQEAAVTKKFLSNFGPG